MANSSLVQALLRGLDVLSFVTEQEKPVRLKDVTAALGLKPTTAHNLLRTLIERRFVERCGVGYRSGVALQTLMRCQAETMVHRVCGDAVQRLAAALPAATVTFAELYDQSVCVSLRVSPDRPGTVQQPHRSTFNIYTSISGLVIQAYAGCVVKDTLRRHYPFLEYGSHLWKSEEKLDAFMASLPAEDVGMLPFEEGRRLRLAAPVFGIQRRFVGAIGLNIPGPVREAKRKELAAVLRREAERASSELDESGLRGVDP